MAMKTHSTLLALLLGGVLTAGAALAQESTEAAQTPADDTTAEAAEPATTNDAADSTEATEPKVGNLYIKETHGDWQLRCIHAPDGRDPCEMFQLLHDEAGNAVAEATLIPIKSEQVAAGMTLTAPLESDLASGVGLQIDSAEPRAYPFAVCTEVGCVSRIGLTTAELDAMRRGAKGTIYVQPFGTGPDTQVELQMSLSGFTAGFNALNEHMAALTADAEAPAEEPAEAPAEEAAEDAPKTE